MCVTFCPAVLAQATARPSSAFPGTAPAPTNTATAPVPPSNGGAGTTAPSPPNTGAAPSAAPSGGASSTAVPPSNAGTAPAAPAPSAAPPWPPAQGPVYGPPTYAPPYGAPPYAYGPYGPPPGWGPPGPDPHAHRHDGFYFRIGLGIAYGQAKTSGTIAGTDLTAHYSGVGPAYELLFGGTVASGFVIGGGFVGQDIESPNTTIESNDPNVPSTLNVSGALGVLSIGPFIDWFPDDTGGAHVGAMFGLGGVGLKDRSGNADIGVGGSVWTGYDFWIADQWSLGGELRAVFAHGTREVQAATGLGVPSTAQFEDSAASFELVVTALLH